MHIGTNFLNKNCMENIEKYDWQTEFDTANETMTTVFSERVKAVTNFKLSTITALKDDVVTYSFGFEEGYSLKEFEQFLLNMAKSAKELEGLNYGN